MTHVDKSCFSVTRANKLSLNKPLMTTLVRPLAVSIHAALVTESVTSFVINGKHYCALPVVNGGYAFSAK